MEPCALQEESKQDISKCRNADLEQQRVLFSQFGVAERQLFETALDLSGLKTWQNLLMKGHFWHHICPLALWKFMQRDDHWCNWEGLYLSGSKSLLSTEGCRLTSWHLLIGLGIVCPLEPGELFTRLSRHGLHSKGKTWTEVCSNWALESGFHGESSRVRGWGQQHLEF